MRKRIVAVCIILALTTAGCFLKRKQPAPAAAPAAAPQRPPIELPPPKVEQPTALEAPKVDMPAPATPAPEPTVIKPKLEKVEPPKPAAKKPARRRVTNSRPAAKAKETPGQPALAPAAPAPAPAEPSQAPAAEQTPAPPPPLPPSAAPAPKLGEVLPADKRKAYQASIDNDLAAAQKVLKEIEGRPLTREQAENADRVRAFIHQAGEARDSDISGAAQLARRAAILAGELVKSLN